MTWRGISSAGTHLFSKECELKREFFFPPFQKRSLFNAHVSHSPVVWHTVVDQTGSWKVLLLSELPLDEYSATHVRQIQPDNEMALYDNCLPAHILCSHSFPMLSHQWWFWCYWLVFSQCRLFTAQLVRDHGTEEALNVCHSITKCLKYVGLTVLCNTVRPCRNAMFCKSRNWEWLGQSLNITFKDCTDFSCNHIHPVR